MIFRLFQKLETGLMADSLKSMHVCKERRCLHDYLAGTRLINV